MKLNFEQAERLAKAFYADEPCRICGKLITMADIQNGAVYAGYSKDNKSRSAHENCWRNQPPKSEWAYPEDAAS